MATSAQYFYDNLGRLVQVLYNDCASVSYSYDELGNRTTVSERPPCGGGDRFGYTLITKTGNFTASDGSGSYYLVTGPSTITMPLSDADGTVMKFKMIDGVGSFEFTGSDEFLHANGLNNQSLILKKNSGVAEIISVAGGWAET